MITTLNEETEDDKDKPAAKRIRLDDVNQTETVVAVELPENEVKTSIVDEEIVTAQQGSETDTEKPKEVAITDVKQEVATTSKTGINNPKSQKFRYGNYNRYYGKRIPVHTEPVTCEDHQNRHKSGKRFDEKAASFDDPRLIHFKREWFENRTILDVGCNIGLVALYLAKNFAPKMITGLDIDQHLIGVARKNVRYYLDENITTDDGDVKNADLKKLKESNKAPFGYFARKYGPISAPPVRKTDLDDEKQNQFPFNVKFKTANYVPENEILLDIVQPEFDTILALSITKWIHLNWGDNGLKLFFKRLHKNLKPGGILLLEPQNFLSYKKRKKLTPEIFEHYQQIKFFPQDFNKYLLGEEIGFESCELVANPKHDSEGFRRPIYLFRKKKS
uniref:RNA methyltransferase n=1 Tax=Romanomermis culicivorax TaxID=13658 RepID=A0A915K7S1_ROMCU